MKEKDLLFEGLQAIINSIAERGVPAPYTLRIHNELGDEAGLRLTQKGIEPLDDLPMTLDFGSGVFQVRAECGERMLGNVELDEFGTLKIAGSDGPFILIIVESEGLYDVLVKTPWDGGMIEVRREIEDRQKRLDAWRVDVTRAKARRALRTFGVGTNYDALQWAKDLDYALDHPEELGSPESVLPTREQCETDRLAYDAINKLSHLRANADKPRPDALRKLTDAITTGEIAEPKRTRSKQIGDWKAPWARFAVGRVIDLVRRDLAALQGTVPAYEGIGIVQWALEAEGVKHGLDPQNLAKCHQEFREISTS